MPNRPCLDCNQPTNNGTRCPRCQQTLNARRWARRTHYHGNWRKTSRDLRAQQPYCSQCGATQDLTVDHITPRTTTDGLDVLCRTCNSRKGGA